MSYKNLSKKVRDGINEKLTKINAYHVIVPQGQIQAILESHGVTVLDDVGYKFNKSFTGQVGSARLNLGLTKTQKRDRTYQISNTCLMISWNCMASGSFEIISYVS